MEDGTGWKLPKKVSQLTISWVVVALRSSLMQIPGNCEPLHDPCMLPV